MRTFFSFCSLLSICLLAESCNYFKGPQQAVFQEYEEPPFGECEPECDYFFPEEFENHLCTLFDLQGQLYNDLIFALTNDAEQEIVQQGISNLLVNNHEIADLFATVYGSKAASRIEHYLCEETQLLIAYIEALKFQNPIMAKELLRESYANSHMLVEFLNIMNLYFARAPETYMMEQHVTLITDQAQAYLQGDIEQAESLNRRTRTQLNEMAFHLSKAVQKQMCEQGYLEFPTQDCPAS